MFFICGYIITALGKRYSKVKSKPNREKHLSQINGLLNTSQEHSFTVKYVKLYEIQNRGGLKKPCDKFFFLIREFERVIRENVDSHDPSPDTFLKAELKEQILDTYMVKHYSEELFPSQIKAPENDDHSYVEDILNIFLTVRGFAVAKSAQKKYRKEQIKDPAKAKSSASLRDALKCISNK